MKFLKCFLPVLFLSAMAPAQTTGAIQGVVYDNNKQPLPGVTIELAGSALQGTRVVSTGADGTFMARVLPVGEYKLTARMQGFADLEQAGILVGLERTITLLVNMQSAFGEKITVTSESPVVDVTSTTTGGNFPKALLDDLPAGRSYQAIAFLSAGSVTAGPSAYPTGNNPSMMGASLAENQYIVDGMDTTDPAYGTYGTNVTQNFVQEIEVKTGGYGAEYGGALGGVVNVVTQQGSNAFRGDLFGYFTSKDLATEGKTVPSPYSASLESFERYDYGIDVGGKIVEDKVWYFAAINPTHYMQDQTLDITRAATDGSFVQRNTPSPEQNADYFAGKLNFQLNAGNSLIATIIGDPRKNDQQYPSGWWVDAPHTGTDAATGSPALTDQYYKDSTQGSWNYGLAHTSILTPTLMLELKAFRHDLREKYLSQYDSATWLDYTSTGAYSDGIGYGIAMGGPPFQQLRSDRSRDQFKAALSWFTGGHEIKLGAQYSQLKYESAYHRSGPSAAHCVPLAPGAVTNDPTTGAPTEIVPDCSTHDDGVLDGWMAPSSTGNAYVLSDGDYFNYIQSNDSTGRNTDYSLFLQDNWKITPHLSLSIGLRAEDQKVQGDLTGKVPARGIHFGLSDQLAPRVGLVWDFAQNGRSKLYAHYGKFYESIPMLINVRNFGNEHIDLLYYYYPDNGMLPNATDNTGQLYYHFTLGGAGIYVDPGIRAPYTEEYLAGAEYEVMPNLAVGVKGIYRDLGQVVEDGSVTNLNSAFVFNPGDCYTTDPATGNPLLDQNGNPTTVCYPKAERTYKAAELTIRRRFAGNWQLYSSLLWSRNRGNYGGLYNQDNNMLCAHCTSNFDLPQLLINANGPLPNDHEWQWKTYGSYRFPFGLVTGFDAEWMTGAPINKLGSHPINLQGSRFINQRGSNGTTPDLWWLNLHFEYPIKLGGGFEVSAISDIFNLTNAQKPSAVDQNWNTLPKSYMDPTDPLDWVDPNEADSAYWNNLSGSACSFWTEDAQKEQYPDWNTRYSYCAAWNPNWGKATAYQDPRFIRIGFKLSW